MKPKIYLAAQFHQKDEIKKRKDELVNLGFSVVSSWTEEIASADSSLKDFNESYHKQYAERDIQEINAADILVLFTVDPDERTRRGGRHFESGYAVGRGKRLIVIGPRENIFHHLREVVVMATWEQFLEELSDGEFSTEPPSTFAKSGTKGMPALIE